MKSRNLLVIACIFFISVSAHSANAQQNNDPAVDEEISLNTGTELALNTTRIEVLADQQRNTKASISLLKLYNNSKIDQESEISVELWMTNTDDSSWAGEEEEALILEEWMLTSENWLSNQ